MTECRIGIAGLGTVGQGVFTLLERNHDLITARTGKKITIGAVCARDRSRKRDISLNGVTWYDNATDLAKDDSLDVVVELIGGSDGIALDLANASIKAGKSFVTANKALIATHGSLLATRAQEQNVMLAFEAAVAGGIPVLKALREGLSANRISRVMGIMNGTCNYILTRMEKEQLDFSTVLSDAQELGYAEADPSFDIDGIDTAHKLAIITSLIFGCPVNLDAVYIDGIRDISLDDISLAREMGYSIKLLGIAQCSDNGIEQRVHPCLVPEKTTLAQVDGVLNAVNAECDGAGAIFLQGAGAGGEATASSVLADIIDIASGRINYPFAIPADSQQPLPIIPIAKHKGCFYVRLKVEDTAGVLADITTSLNQENVGIESFVQHPTGNNHADIAIITHLANEESIKKALKTIEKMEYVKETPHVIRIETL